MERDLRIVGTSLHEEIATSPRRRQLIARESVEVYKSFRALLGQAESIAAVANEQPCAEAECERDSCGSQPPHFRRVRADRVIALRRSWNRIADGQFRSSVGPSLEQRRYVGPIVRR